MPTNRTTAADRLYLCCFAFDERHDEERGFVTGSFQVLVHAPTIKAALDASEERIREMRAEDELFSRPTRIFLEHAIETPEVRGAMLVNFAERMTPQERPLGEILCALPSHRDAKGTSVYTDIDPDADAPPRREPFIAFDV
jgi:hypothetical protein